MPSAVSPDTAAKVDAEIVTIVEAAHQRALKILRENEGALHTLAEYLLERETITGEEFLSMLRGLPEPKAPLLNA